MYIINTQHFCKVIIFNYLQIFYFYAFKVSSPKEHIAKQVKPKPNNFIASVEFTLFITANATTPTPNPKATALNINMSKSSVSRKVEVISKDILLLCDNYNI